MEDIYCELFLSNHNEFEFELLVYELSSDGML